MWNAGIPTATRSTTGLQSATDVDHVLLDPNMRVEDVATD
jgi:hypothetical protein